jgi:transcriptional regulator with XRE-family HTH domain
MIDIYRISVHHFRGGGNVGSIASKRIKDYIESHGLKKKFVSEKTGLSRSALSARLNGDTNFTCDEIYKLCEALNCTPNDLLLQKEE